MRIIKNILCFAIAAVLCMTSFASISESKKARDLTKLCEVDTSPYQDAKKSICNSYLWSRQKFDAGFGVTVSWDETVDAVYLCLQWYSLPHNVTVRLFDENQQVITERILRSDPDSVIRLLPETRSVSITAGEQGMILSQLHVFSDGELPSPFHPWTDTPDHLDYLLISTHPDDDVLYLGSIVPIYGAELGYTGSIVYVASSSRERMNEAENGAWEMGLRCRPLFWSFPDISQKAPKEQKDTFVYDDLVLATVRVYRQYHPLVVFAQDINGEYGHWQHKLTSQAAVEAYTLAADPAYDEESVSEYGTWQVQKLYLHIYPDNLLVLDADKPLEAFHGENAWTVAIRAFRKHESQFYIGYWVEKGDHPHAFNRFGMITGQVEAGEGAFDNIDESLLYQNISKESPS